MRLVRDALRAQALVLALTLAGCLGSGSGSGEERPSSAGAGIGELRLADCTDWRNADVRARFETVRDLRDFAGGPVTGGGHGAVLEDQDAYDLFQSYCANDFALHFKLYKLYTRAAGFRGR